MANNESDNKKGMNTIDAIDESGVLTELERIGAKTGRTTATRTQLEKKISASGKALNSLLQAGQDIPEVRSSPLYQQQVPALQSQIRNIRSKMNSMDAGSVARAESEASTYISRQFNPSTINSQASKMQSAEAVQNRALNMSGMSSDDLLAKREDILTQIRNTERRALKDVKGMFGPNGQVDPEKSAATGSLFGSVQSRVKELASVNSALSLQKITGTDPNSRTRSLVETGEEARRNMSSGAHLRDDLMAEKAKKLIDALDQLASTTGATDEKLAELRNNAEKAAEEYKRTGSSGGGVSGIDRLNAAAGGFTAAGSAVREIMVNQRIGQNQNIAGYANWENQKYDNYKSARGGDIMSQLLLSQSQESEKFGTQLYAGQQAANVAYTAAGAAQTGAGIIQVGEGGGEKWNPATYLLGTNANATQEALQGATNTVQGLATTAVSATDIARGVSAGQADLAGRQSDMEARRALLQVSATQLQGFRDFSVGQGAATMGMGARGEDFLNRTVTNENMTRMVNNRISPEQFNQMSQQGVEQIGSTFNENQIFAARGLEQSGYGSMGTNMQRMATLATAGTNNPQAGLGSVMEAAFSKSLDGSKVLNMMVENTASMVQQSAGTAMGLDTTRTNAAILAAGVAPNAANQEYAVSRAASVQEKLKSIGTDTGVNFGAMAATARIAKNVGVKGDEAIILQSFDDATVKGMLDESKKDPNKVRAMLRDRGIHSLEKKSDKDLTGSLDKLVTERMVTTFTGGSTGLAEGVSNTAVRKVIEDIRSGKLSQEDFANQRNLTPEQAKVAASMSKSAGLQGFGLSEMVRGATGITSTLDPKNGAQVKAGMEGTANNGEMRKTLDDMRTSGFAQLSEAAKEATKNFKSASEAVKGLGALVKQLEQPGMEGKFSDAAAKSASTFGADTVKFGNSVANFDKAVDKLMKMVDIDHRYDVSTKNLVGKLQSIAGDSKQGPKH